MRENDNNNKYRPTTPANQETNGSHTRHVKFVCNEVSTNQHHGLLLPNLPLTRGNKGMECVNVSRLIEPPISPPFSDIKVELPRGDKGTECVKISRPVAPPLSPPFSDMKAEVYIPPSPFTPSTEVLAVTPPPK